MRICVIFRPVGAREPYSGIWVLLWYKDRNLTPLCEREGKIKGAYPTPPNMILLEEKKHWIMPEGKSAPWELVFRLFTKWMHNYA